MVDWKVASLVDVWVVLMVFYSVGKRAVQRAACLVYETAEASVVMLAQ